MTTDRTLRILLVDDEEIVFQTLGDFLTDGGHHLSEARDGLTAWESIQANEYDVALVDVRMPGMDGLSLLARVREARPDLAVIIVTGHGDMETAIEALRLGAADFLTKPVKLLEVKASLERVVQVRTLRRDARHLRETIGGMQTAADLRDGYRELVGVSAATDRVREQIRVAVENGCDTVLITGETGTGKEVVAREMHHQASSSTSPFIAVSCPALPESLVESELFGHTKGAFTGATEARAGYFELADGGTLLLDEIGEISDSAQTKLLRVLETRRIRRVGSSGEIPTEVRVIAATNRRLGQSVEAGRFRRDLLYRLNLYTIHLLPLRERRRDIIPLAEHFLSTYATLRGLQIEGLSTGAKEALVNYDYPGNVRELRNVVERASMLCRSGHIEAKHLALPETPDATDRGDEEQERRDILSALEQTKWNRREAAKKLSMPYSTLRYKIERLGIE